MSYFVKWVEIKIITLHHCLKNPDLTFQKIFSEWIVLYFVNELDLNQFNSIQGPSSILFLLIISNPVINWNVVNRSDSNDEVLAVRQCWPDDHDIVITFPLWKLPRNWVLENTQEFWVYSWYSFNKWVIENVDIDWS